MSVFLTAVSPAPSVKHLAFPVRQEGVSEESWEGELGGLKKGAPRAWGVGLEGLERRQALQLAGESGGQESGGSLVLCDGGALARDPPRAGCQSHQALV